MQFVEISRKAMHCQYMECGVATSEFVMGADPQLKDFAADVGLRTYTQCVNPEKLRLLVRENVEFQMDTGEKPRVTVVGDATGSDPVTGGCPPMFFQ